MRSKLLRSLAFTTGLAAVMASCGGKKMPPLLDPQIPNSDYTLRNHTAYSADDLLPYFPKKEFVVCVDGEERSVSTRDFLNELLDANLPEAAGEFTYWNMTGITVPFETVVFVDGPQRDERTWVTDADVRDNVPDFIGQLFKRLFSIPYGALTAEYTTSAPSTRNIAFSASVSSPDDFLQVSGEVPKGRLSGMAILPELANSVFPEHLRTWRDDQTPFPSWEVIDRSEALVLYSTFFTALERAVLPPLEVASHK